MLYSIRGLVILMSLMAFTTYSQSYKWARTVGGASPDIANSVATDAFGNVYVVGFFEDTVDFDPTGATDYFIASGADMFLTKYDIAGNYLWTKQAANIIVNELVLDASGNIYISGVFGDTTDFDLSAGTAILGSNGFSDGFVAKYDSSGSYQWAINMGGPSMDRSSSLALDSQGNVYVAGFFEGTADFDPSAANASLSSNQGSSDIFLAKYNSSGSYLWAKKLGGASFDAANSIAVDYLGNVFLSGGFRDTADFDPSTNTANLVSKGNGDVFFAKYDSSGSLLWAKSIGGASYEHASSIAVDASGNLYLTGFFTLVVDFDPSGATTNLSAVGNRDIFLAKYDASGTHVWAKSIGGSHDDFGYSVTIDTSGAVYLAGNFRGTASIDSSGFSLNLMSNGSDDILLARYSSAGQFLWVRSIGGSTYERVSSLAMDRYGDTYITGRFVGTTDLDPSPATANAISVGTIDVFLAKYGMPCSVDTAHLNRGVCDSLISPSGNYTWYTTGIYADTLATPRGCDSIVILNLTVHTADTSLTQSGIVLTANATNASYQWLDCNNAYAPIPGETGQSFTATANGKYAVEVTQNACVDTSACYDIQSVGLSTSTMEALRIYPNPTSGKVNIELPDSQEFNLKVFDASGRLIFSDAGVRPKYQLNLSSYPDGLYRIYLQHEDQVFSEWIGKK